MGVQVICERSEQKKTRELQNCRILCYADFDILDNLPSKIIFSQFWIFYFSPTFSRRHLPSTVNGVDAPAQLLISVGRKLRAKIWH